MHEARRLETDLLPTSSEDFERLVLATPNSVYLYVQYISFLLSRTEIERARQLFERGVRKIRFESEQDKLNLYLSMLNLESKFGNLQTLNDTYRRASSACDPVKVYLRYVDILIELDEQDRLKTLMKMGLKKFKTSLDVWKRHLIYAVKNGHETKTLLNRGLLVLPKREHVTLIEYLARIEFEHGDENRARTVFEKLVASHPKRWDIWSRYLDQEIRRKNLNESRTLFERVQSQRWHSKRMKALYKRWYDFEAENDGDVERVAALARQYIQGLEKKEDDEEESGSDSSDSDSDSEDDSSSEDDE